MSNFKERLQEEQIELKKKITKLDIFLASTANTNIVENEAEVLLLEIQLSVMRTYLTILNLRVAIHEIK